MTRAPKAATDPLLALSLESAVAVTAFAQRFASNSSRLQHASGAVGIGSTLAAHCCAQRLGAPLVYLTADNATAQVAVSDLQFLSQRCPLKPLSQCAGPHTGGAVLSLQADEGSVYLAELGERRSTQERLATLYQLNQHQDWEALVVPAGAFILRAPPPDALQGLAIHKGQSLDSSDVATQLNSLGYLRVPLVEDAGTFAVRGALLDVWPAGLMQPVRIELLGDDVLSIKNFDPATQRALSHTTQVELPPARLLPTLPSLRERARERLVALYEAANLPSSKTRAFVDRLLGDRLAPGIAAYLPAFYDLVPLTQYLPENALVVIEDPPSFVAALHAHWAELEAHEPPAAHPHYEPALLALSEDNLQNILAPHRVLCLHRSAVTSDAPQVGLARFEIAPSATPSLEFRDHSELRHSLSQEQKKGAQHATLDPLWRQLTAFQEQGLRVVLSARTTAQAQRLASLLEHRGFSASVLAEASAPVETAAVQSTAIEVIVAALTHGVTAPLTGLALLTEEEIFGQRSHRGVARRGAVQNALEDLRALQPGDWVVHTEHGIGRYLGLERRKVADQASVELLVIEYAGSDRLLLPVYRLSQLQKYLGKEGSPKLDRLGGSTFARTKAKVRRRVREMADELLRLYADRAAVEKTPLPAKDDDYATFEAQFPFEETPDQAAAIQDVLGDLEKPQVMDRLVCGDVGFGKTEVALRAAFRHAMAGRQVALLCPTTVLAQQHAHTFSQRLKNTPIRIATLSRFQSAADLRETAQRIRSGEVDLVVGTHRLLSRDIHFKSLGLLIIDEEQRFGVAHKERIKQLRTNIDVLTLTATPIPRTLQLAVGGLRDLSVIQTPPHDRRAIRTLIVSYDESTVREAIRRELQRGGQVYYVYNRVEDIHQRANAVMAIVPEARVAVAHGQMSAAALENTMLGFVQGDYDVLVCTAIVESGLDIPRANTLLIDRAELFGLAQLHQLRGRVGRSAARAYCYLMVPAPSALSAEARTRIEALARYSELGSGLHLATLDMELRGAGNLLGADQSGSVEGVGLQLFCQMLADAAQELRGIEVTHEVDPDLSFDVEALLPESYVEDIGLRLTLYKRLASASDEGEVMALAAELEDRFGPPPVEVERLVALMRIKVDLRRLRVLACEASRRGVTLHLKDDTPLDRERLQELLRKPGSPYRITPDRRLTRRLGENEQVKGSLELVDKMLSELLPLC